MNIAIIEDEALTAEDLSNVLYRLGGNIRLSVILSSVEEGIKYFRDNPPIDLIFSDIQLGDGLSFEIFRSVRVTAPIIFCTAYDEYALQAIRSNGIEYILKPFTLESVSDAIAKFSTLKRHFLPTTADFLQIPSDGNSSNSSLKAILVHYKDKIVPLPLSEIAVAFIDGTLIKALTFDNRLFTISQTLEELESLGKTIFFRVNRQNLVHRNAVIDANHYPNRKYVVNLSIPRKEIIVVSKNRTSAFLQWLTRQ